MSDVLSVRKAAIEEWRLPTSGENDILNRAICQALRDLRAEEFWFNVATFTLTTVISQTDYTRLTKNATADATKLRWDFFGVLGRYLHFDVDASTNRPFRRIRSDNHDHLRRLNAAYNTDADPVHWAYWNHTLILQPPPATAGTIHGRCLLDLETPVPRYDNDASAWRYDGADGNAIGIDIDKGWQEDNSGSSYVDLTAAMRSPATADVSPFPAGAGDNDAVYFGFDWPTTALSINVSTAGAGTYTVTWEYYNGTAWTALTGLTDNTSAFKSTGANTVVWSKPHDQAASSVNSSASLYWVRARRDAGTVTTDPVFSTAASTDGIDLFTNRWFTEGFDVVLTRTMYHYWRRYRRDDIKANAALEAYVESRRELRRNTTALMTQGSPEANLGTALGG